LICIARLSEFYLQARANGKSKIGLRKEVELGVQALSIASFRLPETPTKSNAKSGGEKGNDET
jgi:hypothetical protein